MHVRRYNLPYFSFNSADPSLSSEFHADATLGVRQIAQIKETVDSLFFPPTHHFVSPSDEIPSLQLPKIRKDEGVEIIPISLGCLGACTFCQTRLARGKLWSYPIDEIIKRVHAVSVFYEKARPLGQSERDFGDLADE